MPGFKVNRVDNNDDTKSQEVSSGPLGEILSRLQATMEEEAKQRASDLTPSATFEPSMSRPSSPVNFPAYDAMDIDHDDEYTPPEIPPAAASSKPKAKTRLDLAQEYLSQARETLKKENPELKDRLPSPTAPACGRTQPVRPELAVREDPKAQLMRVLYQDPTWTAQRILDENDRAVQDQARKRSFWDEM